MKHRLTRPAANRWFALPCLLPVLSISAHATEITVAYQDNPQASAKSQMLRHILESRTDIQVTLEQTSVEDMWAGVAEGRFDCSVSVFYLNNKP